MTDLEFGYKAVIKSDKSNQVTSLIAYQVPLDKPMQAVMWSVPEQTWIYAPAIASAFLFDDQYLDRARNVDRTTAEQIAAETLGTELPSETALQELIDEGRRMGWELGPPRE
jgi:hypothetical protein